MNNIQTLITWIRVVEVIAAICTTSVPVIYSFSGRNRGTLGRLFMWKAISFAAAIDSAAIFTFWRSKNPHVILVILWFDAIALTAIACSNAAMAFYILYLNHIRKKDASEIH